MALGCGAAMCSLRRSMAAGYTLSDAVTLEQLLAAEDPAEFVRPVDGCFAQYPAVTIDGKDLFRAKNGTPFPWEGPEDTFRVYDPDGNFLLLGESKDGVMTTIKSFFETNY